MTKTKIEWADYTWNPVWGCLNKCQYCYARKIAQRFKQLGMEDFKPTWIEKAFNKPFPKKPSIIFVNSMSDPSYWQDEWMTRVLRRIVDNKEHTFIFLTKDEDFARCFYDGWGSFGDKISLKFGISLDTVRERYFLYNNMSYFHIANFEPLLCRFPVDLLREILDGKELVIIGAETGNRAGKVEPKKEWVEGIVNESKRRGIPVFMKPSLIPYCEEWGIEYTTDNPYRR